MILILLITGGKVSEVSVPHLISAQAIIIEVKQLQTLQAEAIKDQEAVHQALNKAHRTHQQLKLQLKQNVTLGDGLQGQLETLQLARAVLQSNTAHISERLLHSFYKAFWIHLLLVVTLICSYLTGESCGQCLSGWFLFNTSCYFHSLSTSNPLKSWQDSRADCISRGGNLTVISNLEEQVSPVGAVGGKQRSKEWLELSFMF